MSDNYVSYEQQYIDNVKNILKNGALVLNDRTGKGTRMLTGLVWRANLQKEFPLLTTKHVGIYDVDAEVRVFAKGSTCNHDFLAENCKIWNEWAGKCGMLGPIYPAMWRRRPASVIQSELIHPNPYDASIDTDYGLITKYVAEPFRIPDSKKATADEKLYYKVIYAFYRNAILKAVTDRVYFYKPWLKFENFLNDFFTLPGCEQAIICPNGYDIVYQNRNTNMLGPKSLQFIHTSVAGPARTCKFDPLRPIYAPVHYIDQLTNAIEELRSRNSSRRIVVDSWEPSVLPLAGIKPNEQPDIGRQVLACCHDHFQFHYIPPTSDGEQPKVSISVVMRSNDVCLGQPYNMASYSLLLMKVAKILGFTPWEVTIFTGDTHIYLNHIDTVKKQIRRKIHKAPVVTITGEQQSITDFKREDIKIERFNKGVKTYYEVAV